LRCDPLFVVMFYRTFRWNLMSSFSVPIEFLEQLSAEHKHTTIPRNVSPHITINSSTAVSHTVLWLAVQFSCNIQHWQHCDDLCELLWSAAVCLWAGQCPVHVSGCLQLLQGHVSFRLTYKVCHLKLFSNTITVVEMLWYIFVNCNWAVTRCQ